MFETGTTLNHFPFSITMMMRSAKKRYQKKEKKRKSFQIGNCIHIRRLSECREARINGDGKLMADSFEERKKTYIFPIRIAGIFSSSCCWPTIEPESILRKTLYFYE